MEGGGKDSFKLEVEGGFWQVEGALERVEGGFGIGRKDLGGR